MLSNIFLDNYAKNYTNNSLDCTLTLKKKLRTLSGNNTKSSGTCESNKKSRVSRKKNPKSTVTNYEGRMTTNKTPKNLTSPTKNCQTAKKTTEKVFEVIPKIV